MGIKGVEECGKKAVVPVVGEGGLVAQVELRESIYVWELTKRVEEKAVAGLVSFVFNKTQSYFTCERNDHNLLGSDAAGRVLAPSFYLMVLGTFRFSGATDSYAFPTSPEVLPLQVVPLSQPQ